MPRVPSARHYAGRAAGWRLELHVYTQLELRRGAWLERGAQRGLEPTADAGRKVGVEGVLRADAEDREVAVLAEAHDQRQRLVESIARAGADDEAGADGGELGRHEGAQGLCRGGAGGDAAGPGVGMGCDLGATL